jgi:hypothetical protein
MWEDAISVSYERVEVLVLVLVLLIRFLLRKQQIRRTDSEGQNIRIPMVARLVAAS